MVLNGLHIKRQRRTIWTKTKIDCLILRNSFGFERHYPFRLFCVNHVDGFPDDYLRVSLAKQRKRIHLITGEWYPAKRRFLHQSS